MKREIDFKRPRALDYRGRQAKGNGGKGNRAVIAMLLIMAAVIACSSAWLGLRRQQLIQQSAEIQEYLESSDDIKRENELLEIQNEYIKLKQKNDTKEALQGLLATYPLLSENDYTALLQPLEEGMSLKSLKYDQTGVLSAVLSCKSEKDVPDYVERVQNGGVFSNVSYNGWNLDQGYSFQINCLLKGEGETK